MKKTVIICVLATLMSACTKDLTKLNVDPINPTSVPSYSLFTESQRILTNTLTSTNVNLNIFRLIEQQWQETTYTTESNYDIVDRPIPDNLWNALYATVLQNFQKAKLAVPNDVKGGDAATTATLQKTDLAMIDIMQVYTYYYLVTTFGNVPYTDALNINNPFPKFDDAKTIYADLLKRMDADIAALAGGQSSFGSADVVYGGDVTKWLKFANSFKLKMGITIADSDPATAAAVIQSAVDISNGGAGVFTSNADNAIYQYLSSPPYTNPIWEDLIQSGRQDFVACSTIIGFLIPGSGNPDPRLPYYFTTITATNTAYAGLDPGANGAFTLYSKPSGPGLVSTSVGKISNPDFPGDLLDYAETEFNLAEAAQRGFIESKAATASHYNAGVTASIEYWKTDDPSAATAQAATYLQQPNVAFATATGANELQRIAFQKYLALYNRGWDAWTETRRLGYPALVAPPTALSAFPLRLKYPKNEQNVNVTNYNQAASAIGGDVVTTRLFFLKSSQ